MLCSALKRWGSTGKETMVCLIIIPAFSIVRKKRMHGTMLLELNLQGETTCIARRVPIICLFWGKGTGQIPPVPYWFEHPCIAHLAWPRPRRKVSVVSGFILRLQLACGCHSESQTINIGFHLLYMCTMRVFRLRFLQIYITSKPNMIWGRNLQ